MKSKILIKVVIVFLVIALTVQCNAFFVFAQVEINTANRQKVITQVTEMVPAIYEIDSTDEIYIGTKMSVYNVVDDALVQQENDVYPLYIGNIIVGIVNVVYRNSSVYQVSINQAYAEALDDFLKEHFGIPYAIIHIGSDVYIKLESDNNMYCLVRSSKSLLGNEVSGLNNLNYILPIKDICVPCNISYRSNSVLFKTLPIDYVCNDSTSCCPTGICWAASIAMITNYHMGQTYTALDIHDRCGCITSNYHNEEKQYLRQLGMYAGGPYYSTGIYRFSLSSLYDCIEDDMLLILDLQEYGVAAHNVVAYGYYASATGAAYFYYMDPNTGGNIASFPDSSDDVVYVPLSGHNYQVHCYITAS